MTLLVKIRVLLSLFIGGLVLAGVTAIPLLSEVDYLSSIVRDPAWLANWLSIVKVGLHDASLRYPFLMYGTDWLAFGHFVIAIVFIGPFCDPVRNVWVVKFGMIASALVIPYAVVFGALRGIPFGWRMIDASFGIAGLALLVPCLRCTARLALRSQQS